jgi:hypothetical protein
MEPERGRRLIAIARAIEGARAQSLADLVGANVWDAAAHDTVLDATVVSFDGAARAEFPDGPCPRRIEDGPVRYTIVDDFDEEERAFVEEKLSAHYRGLVELLVNLCNGERTIEEIALRLALDLDQPFSVDDTERSVELLVKAGYLAV